MTTQGISIVTAKISDQAAARGSKSGDAGFDSFMTERASKVSASQKKDSRSEKQDHSLDTGIGNRAENSVSLKKEPAVQTKNPEMKNPMVRPQNTVEETVDPEAVAYQMAAMFKEVLGMDINILQDMMQQTGMDLRELMGSLGDENGSMALQNLVMDFHGITDKAAFLTNDKLVEELSVLNQKFAQIVSEALGVSVEELGDMDPSVLTTLADQVDDALSLMAYPETMEDAGDGQEQMPEMMAENQKPGFEVIVEEAKSGNSDAQTGTFAGRHKEEPVMQNDNTAANLFTERLAEAYESSAGKETPSAGQLMTHIVDQVVEQVKIRVMPETTSMELMLHPESLGRVNIQVSAAAGVAKATLIVENLMAKEALESQLMTLKETFAEQGLKVDAVEVTVSEFGLNQENRQTQQDQQNGSTKRRRFRTDDGIKDDMAEETGTEGVRAERRDSNSVVDYTA